MGRGRRQSTGGGYSSRGPSVVTISKESELQEMDNLDAIAFGDHEGIGVDALAEIRDNGHLFAIRNQDQMMIGEAQLITEAIPSAKEHIVRNLRSDQAYFEGFGVHPDHQGQGIGKDLINKVIEEAQREGKKEIISTVRAENPASLAAMLQNGFRVVGFDPNYYSGENGEGHRLVCSKSLTDKENVSEKGAQPFHSRQSAQPTFVSVEGGDGIDSEAREEIETLLAEGRVGVRVLRSAREGHFRIIFSSVGTAHPSALNIDKGLVSSPAEV